MDTVLLVASAGCAFLSLHHLSILRKETARNTQQTMDMYNAIWANDAICREHSRGISTPDQCAELDNLLLTNYNVHRSTTNISGNMVRTDFTTGNTPFYVSTYLKSPAIEPRPEVVTASSPEVDRFSAFMFAAKEILSDNVEKTYDFAYL